MKIEPDLNLARRFVAASEIPGRLLLGGITGSHHYGFASPDSDLDIKAIHLAPTESMLGLTAHEDAFERLEEFEGVECDLTSNEVGQALRLLLRGNGNMLERILCPYQLVDGPEVDALQGLARGALSRRFHDHYAGFFRAMRKDFERSERPSAKQVLYAYRVALTGIQLLRTGKLEADLSVLAEPYGFSEILAVLHQKRAGEERAPLASDAVPLFRERFHRVEAALDESLRVTALPENAPNFSDCERWLVEIRRAALRSHNATA